MSEETVVEDVTTETTTTTEDVATETTTDAVEGSQTEVTDPQPDETQQGDSDKGSETPEGAPESYDLQTPEGMEVDQKLMEQFEGIARDANLTNEQANKFATMYAERVQAMNEANSQAWTTMQEGWVNDLKNDSEFGGQKFAANVEIARSAVVQYGGEDLATALKDLGMDNHPQLVKAFYKVGTAISEDTAVTSSDIGGNKSNAQSLYTNSNMNP